ncbi:hypothetical protein CLU96_3994 [Chryseobacterium sp. 52]|uniref:hypothetical protein n=1 Tax=Chryseobacterium sp. 52 TaxID=2035213 RepID=UPI000C199609|nr:hypothetical protein [Chryseobacterium sp. 52]PIF46948.1 hypothetical protein CLU96_3994 [Chryseobacterium sp. 52]
MKKILLPIILFLAGTSLANAQVGVNTTSPASTLDVAAKTPTGTSTGIDGLLIPRVDRQRAQSMAAVPISTLIYVNSIATGTLTGTAINIDAAGYYYFNGTVWTKLNPVINIYTSNGTLTAPRTVTTNGNFLNFVNGTTNVGINTTATEGRISASGPSRGSITFNGGSANLDMYVDDTNAAQINSSGNSTKLSMGTTNTAPLTLKTNGTEKVSILGNGNMGIGTTTPNTTLELASGTANTSGLRLTNLTSVSPIGTGQAIGVDSSGNIVTVANPNPTNINTSSVNSTAGTSFNVNDLTASIVSGTSQTIAIPVGGKALFINFMLGIDYTNNPPGSGVAYYEARLYIDGVATDCYMRTQEIGVSANAFFNISTIKFLAAGSHIIDVRMLRTFNNGTTSGANMACNPISMSFNNSYLN